MDMYGYTQHIENHYWGLLKQVNHNTIQQLQTVAINDSNAEIEAAIEQFRTDYTCSARRFLMNFLQKRATATIPSLKQYSYIWNGGIYLFSTVDDVAVSNLDAEERNQYIQLICEIAAANQGDSTGDWRPLIRKAMLWNKHIELINKAEAFQIGHGLQFNLEEMNDFLLRVLDNEDLSYGKSEDVIEAFCFLFKPANNWHIAKALKKEYAARISDIVRRTPEEKPMDFTVAIEESLKSKICNWQERGGDVQAAFMDWLVARAAYMDLPSQRAVNVYRRLTKFALEVTTEQRVVAAEKDLMPELMAYCRLSDPIHIESESAYETADKILSVASLEFDNLRKRQPNQIWRYLTVDRNGKPIAVAIGARIPDLLLGRRSVTKADVLFMLWYLCDLCWLEGVKKTNGNIIADRIADFWSMSETLLENAGLPEFYAPHMLERCFLKSICAVESTAENPFEIYEGLCEFVLPEKQVRSRSKQGTRSEKSRALLEKETAEQFLRGKIDFEGVECLVANHLLIHGAKGRKYVFSEEGIYFPPNPEIAMHYPKKETGNQFNRSAAKYSQQTSLEKRFRFVYGISLFLIEVAERAGIECEFRTNYQKNVSLTILKWNKVG